jgi:hypothetical protein
LSPDFTPDPSATHDVAKLRPIWERIQRARRIQALHDQVQAEIEEQKAEMAAFATWKAEKLKDIERLRHNNPMQTGKKVADEFRKTGNLNPLPELLMEMFQTLPMRLAIYGVDMDVVLAPDSTPDRLVFPFKWYYGFDVWQDARLIIEPGTYTLEGVDNLTAYVTFLKAFRRVFG